MTPELLAGLNAARAARQPATVVTALGSGEQRLVLDPAGDPVGAEIAAALRAGRSRTIETGSGEKIFLNVQAPPPRLVVVGAVHVAQTLAPLAAGLGYEVFVVDPRTAFATEERFPGVALRAEWPDEAVRTIGLDPYTAVAALSHDPKIDDPALVAALAEGCFYVGALGSRKTHAARVDRLAALGATEAALARIRSPIGLAIGAASPGEIAVAVMAEITAALRRPGAL